MSNQAKSSDNKPAQKSSKVVKTTSSEMQTPQPVSERRLLTMQSMLGNQATLRLLRAANTPTIQRNAHERGCSCPSCARIQRQREEKQLQRALIQRDGSGQVVPSIPFSELMALWRGREQKDKPVAPTQGVHAPVVVPAGPTTAAEVRGKVSSASPGSGGAAAFLAERVQELRGLNLSSEVPTQADLIPILADDLERKNSTKTGEEHLELSRAEWLEAARDQIESNNTTALTTSDDRYTAIQGGVAFDELHEYIHICSGQGGDSPLNAFKLQVNEGAINVFSELVAPLVGTPLVTRYTAETPIMRGIVALLGGEGIGLLYNATFKGELDPLFNALGAAYVALGDNNPNGKAKTGREKGLSASAAAAEYREKLANWSVGWLKQKLP